jgi:hypothetical protein
VSDLAHQRRRLYLRFGACYEDLNTTTRFNETKSNQYFERGDAMNIDVLYKMVLHVKFYVNLSYNLDLNIDIASRINEEIRFALDPKELESFARQIATGMVNYNLQL